MRLTDERLCELRQFADITKHPTMTDLLDTIEALQQENERLDYTLIGVMHSVYKWLDDTDGMDEVNRAAQAREIALQAIEKRDAALKKAREALTIVSDYYSNVLNMAAWKTVKEALAAIDKALGGKEDV